MDMSVLLENKPPLNKNYIGNLSGVFCISSHSEDIDDENQDSKKLEFQHPLQTSRSQILLALGKS